MVPVAAWNQEIADNRSKVLKKIANDPTRKDQWAAYQAAQNAYAKMVAGRGDDPLFIHSKEYDRNVEKAQQPYVHFFEKDIGAGGWQSINDAHLALINQALDRVSGQKQVIVIIFGSWHKCKIINGLSKRNDVILRDSKTLFR
ncbi:MAG: hypothetical protein HC843_13190 [Sphingomonadales bacterium]|nr:hypothetical protein [Sphingomonadales bacterium]